jgi:hypothetical protein
MVGFGWIWLDLVGLGWTGRFLIFEFRFLIAAGKSRAETSRYRFEAVFHSFVFS